MKCLTEALSKAECFFSALMQFKIISEGFSQVLPLMFETPSPLPPHFKHPNYHCSESAACEITHLFLTGWKLPQDSSQFMLLNTSLVLFKRF